MTKTMHGQRHPAPREVAGWKPATSREVMGMTACSNATADGL
jgi:hypothetical protein